MTKQKRTPFFKYTLSTPIEIFKDGANKKFDDIIVKGPRPKDKSLSMALESIYMQAMKKNIVDFQKIKKDDNSNKNKKGNGEEVDKESEKDDEEGIRKTYDLVSMGGVDHKQLDSIFYYMSELLTAGNQENPQCTLGGVKMTKPIFDEIEIDDLRVILSMYLHYFLSQALR